MDLEAAAALLEQSDEYRVLRRLRMPAEFSPLDPSQTLTGIVLDVETTGLATDVDEVIELAMLKFTFSREGLIGKVADVYQSFNEPSTPIPDAITKLTGIADADVAGTKIKAEDLAAFTEGAALIIAHNATFDRPFCEQLYLGFREFAWGCSATEVPWRDEGMAGGRLAYIAGEYGWFYDAHRANDDCDALLFVLSLPLPRSGDPVMAALLRNARRVDARIFAEGAPYELKVQLRHRGYRWNDGLNGYPRAWWRDVDIALIDQELAVLAALDKAIAPRVFRMSAKERFRRENLGG